MVRLVAAGGAVGVSLDAGAGRGAYVCPDPGCLAAALRGKLARALRTEAALPAPCALALLVREAVERKVSALLGQGRRMRAVASGQEAVGDRLARGTVSLLLLAVDAPPGSEGLAAAALAAGVPVGRALTRGTLGEALGTSPRWAAVVEDRHLAAGIVHYLGFLRGEAGDGAEGAVGTGPRAEARRVGGGQGG
jgi:ribosomal protein L7Ae-like RNA K-turn-binding protein